MPATLISEWRTLRRGRPGHRFQERYEASRRAKNRRSIIGRIVRLGLAIVALAIGIVLMFIPGPAILFYLISGSLLAAESRVVARALDWSEVQLRKSARWLKIQWRKLPLAGKIFAGLAVLAIGAAGLFLGYKISFG
jgi:hypothetical protein